MVEKQEVGCDVAVPDVMPIETSLPSVGRTRSDGTFLLLLGFDDDDDDDVLDSALLEDQVVAQLVGRAP